MTLVAARVKKEKQTIAYFTLVECKQIQLVRIELKSPIQSYIPPFTPQEMEVGKCDDKLKEWPFAKCMCACVQMCTVQVRACWQIDSKLRSEYFQYSSMPIDPWGLQVWLTSSSHDGGSMKAAPEPWHTYRGDEGGGGVESQKSMF